MADELRVSITADASGVGPAVAQATAAVESSADQIAAAQAKATAATKALTEAQIQLGAAAEGGSAAAAGIIEQYAQASAMATAAVEQLTAAEASNTSATLSNAAAQRVDTAATYSHSEAMGAAKVSMGAMTGSTHMMEMGLAKLAAGSSVVGPLLAAMVPVAIFAAGVFLLYDLGQALYNAFDLGGERARKTADEIESANVAFRSFIDSTDVEIDKLQIANAKLEGKPAPNGMKLAIDEALEEADKLDAKLEGLLGKEETILKGMAGSIPQQLLGTGSSDKYEETMLSEHRRHLAEQTSTQGELNESVSYYNSLLTREGDLQRQMDAAITAPGRHRFQAELDAVGELLDLQGKEQRSIQASIDLQKLQDEHGNPAQPKGVKTVSDNLPEQIAKAQIDAAHAADAELAPQQEIVAAMDKQIELNNLKARFSKEGTAAERETLRVMENQIALSQAKEKIDALGREQLNRTFEEEQKAQAEAQRRQQEQARAALEESNRARAEQVSAARETAAATIEAANQEFERTQIEIRGQEELGLISHRVAQQRLLDALKLRETTTQGALKTEQGLFNPVTGEKEATEYKKLEDQMTKEAQRAALERERIVQQEATKMEQVYKRVANEFNTDFTRAFNEWATKSQTAGQAFGHMLGDMELQVADFAAKWILQKVEMWAMSKLLDATGYATQFAIQKSANVAAVTSDAGVAAAGAMAYYSAINPPAAPAMAALQFAETMSYAVMDTGGMMPHMGMAFNTSGSVERVLSPSQTSNFESLVNNGGSRSAHLHQTNNYGGAPTKEMHEAQTAHTISRLKSMLRPEAFA